MPQGKIYFDKPRRTGYLIKAFTAAALISLAVWQIEKGEEQPHRQEAPKPFRKPEALFRGNITKSLLPTAPTKSDSKHFNAAATTEDTRKKPEEIADTYDEKLHECSFNRRAREHYHAYQSERDPYKKFLALRELSNGDAFKKLMGGTYKDYRRSLAQQAQQAAITLWHRAHTVSQTDWEKYKDLDNAWHALADSDGESSYGADGDFDSETDRSKLYREEDVEGIMGFTQRMLLDEMRKYEQPALKQVISALRAYPDNVDLSHPNLHEGLDMHRKFRQGLYSEHKELDWSQAQATRTGNTWSDVQERVSRKEFETKPEDHQCARLALPVLR